MGTLEDRWLLGAEVAEKIRRSIGTLYNWRSRGIGPASSRIAGKVMYRESDVDKWIAAEEEGSRRGGGDAA